MLISPPSERGRGREPGQCGGLHSSHGRLSGHCVSVFPREPKVAPIHRVNVAVLAGWTSQRSLGADLNRGSRALVTTAALRGPCFNQRYQKRRSMSISMRLVATGWWAMKPGGGERRETLLMWFSQLVWIQLKAISYSGGGVFHNERWHISIATPASLQEPFHTTDKWSVLVSSDSSKIKFLLDFNQFFGDYVY